MKMFPRGWKGPAATLANSRQALDQQSRPRFERKCSVCLQSLRKLKDQVDNTNSNSVLNRAVPKRAQEIEKLAKQIRDGAGK